MLILWNTGSAQFLWYNLEILYQQVAPKERITLMLLPLPNVTLIGTSSPNECIYVICKAVLQQILLFEGFCWNCHNHHKLSSQKDLMKTDSSSSSSSILVIEWAVEKNTCDNNRPILTAPCEHASTLTLDNANITIGSNSLSPSQGLNALRRAHLLAF